MAHLGKQYGFKSKLSAAVLHIPRMNGIICVWMWITNHVLTIFWVYVYNFIYIYILYLLLTQHGSNLGCHWQRGVNLNVSNNISECRQCKIVQFVLTGATGKPLDLLFLWKSEHPHLRPAWFILPGCKRGKVRPHTIDILMNFCLLTKWWQINQAPQHTDTLSWSLSISQVP